MAVAFSAGGVPQRLLRAYRATDYAVAGVSVRIGRRSRAMDALLGCMGVRRAAFITAWNPWSRPMPEGWNRRMQHGLEARLRRWPRLPADGMWRRWYEAHMFVAADPRAVLRQARVFRQRGVVLLARNRPARLALLSAGAGAGTWHLCTEVMIGCGSDSPASCRAGTAAG